VGESDDHSPDDLGDILGKLSYSGIFPDQAITFTDGYYYYSEGGSGKPYVRLISPLIRTGDINQDGVEDAVFLLEDNSEGSADFTLLGAVLNVWANPKPVDVVQVEDRIAVKSFSLDGPRVIVEFIGHGQGDVDCCPTLNVRQVFEFKDGRMTQASREELSKASAADLYGTSWRLVDLNGDQEPVLPNSEITLNIEEGQVNGFAGCNHYNSSVTVDQEFPNELTVGPISSTQKACEDPISKQEAIYLTRLGTVYRWAYHFGQLVLFYPLEGNTLGELTFEPK
jgi:heat shock protein HslJ